MTRDLSTVKAGDKLFVSSSGYGNNSRLTEVAAVKIQYVVDANGLKWDKRHGRERGSTGYNRSYAEPYEPATHDPQLYAVKVARMAARLSDCKWSDLPPATIERIWAIVFNHRASEKA